MKQKWPDIKVDDYPAAIDFIIKFYQELGWNLVEAIDPMKIKIHPEMWGDIVDQLREKWGLSAALGWMNIGPSADESNVYNLDNFYNEKGYVFSTYNLFCRDTKKFPKKERSP